MPAPAGAPPGGTFDEQAPRYDARVGLPASIGLAVAEAVVAQAGAGADVVVLELGAGTGQIGAHLARLPVEEIRKFFGA